MADAAGLGSGLRRRAALERPLAELPMLDILYLAAGIGVLATFGLYALALRRI